MRLLDQGLKREELIASNSMILHELFFASLGEESEPWGALRDALTRDFGSVDHWRAEFSAMGKAQAGGSGWVLLIWSPRDRKLINQWAMDHTTTFAGGQPILALDTYEHSYHLDYRAKAIAYVDAFMMAINWPSLGRFHRDRRLEVRHAQCERQRRLRGSRSIARYSSPSARMVRSLSPDSASGRARR